jgi:rhodanese-related sulfurtransferase
MTKEELAAMMYDTLQSKIKTLPDHLIVYPAHGPGSSCGKNLGPDTFSTIGAQKQTNYALQDMSKEDFVKSVTEGLAAPPAYFPINAKINKEGYDSLDDVLATAKPLSVDAFKQHVEEGSWILDTRPSTIFTTEFVPESINIGLDGRFAEWAGTLLPFTQPLVLVTEVGKEKESIIRLARVGIDNVQGFLEGGLQTWKDAGQKIDMIIDIDAEELAMDLPHDSKLEIIDVRKQGEFDAGHVKGAANFPLDTLTNVVNIAGIDDEKNLYVHCAGGYRSVIAASLLKRQGYHNLRNVLGGYAKMKHVKNIPIITQAVKV